MFFRRIKDTKLFFWNYLTFSTNRTEYYSVSTTWTDNLTTRRDKKTKITWSWGCPCQDWWSLKITKCIFLFSYLCIVILTEKRMLTKQLEIHTSYNSFCKWTKISSLEIDIFDLKMMVKRGLEFVILKFSEPLQSCCCSVPEWLN